MTSLAARATLGSLVLAFGCGSAQHPAEPAAPPKPSAETASQTATPSTSSSGSATPPDDAKTSDSTDAKPETPGSEGKASKAEGDAKPTAAGDEKGSAKAREVTFEMTPGGLVINVEGVRMEPKAEAIRLDDEQGKQIGWGVRLTVKTTATDGHVHRFTRPEHGPLMVAAELDRKGKKERIGDERKGDGEETVTEGMPITLARDFKKAIGSGQSVTLFVGLWGLGRDTEEKRLVRKLFVVKMVAGNKKPKPVVSPPE